MQSTKGDSLALVKEVEAFMDRFAMWPQNGHIVVGISGGPDSVCLLAVLVRLRKRHNLLLTAVHVHHGLREEADDDADFVRRLCRQWDVPFVLKKADVRKLACDSRISCEEAGRMARYEAFSEVLRRIEGGTKGGCIAVAHNRDDRAETFLFHLFRGTGLKGMGSIQPVRGSKDGSRIIRPLLFCGRERIEAWLKEEGICWRVDRSNLGEDFSRNKIRNRVLPYVQREICSQAGQNLAREAELLSDAHDFLERAAREAAGRCSVAKEDEGICFDVAAFEKEDAFLQDQMLYQTLVQMGGGKDLTAAHIREIRRLFAPSCQSGKKVSLPFCGVTAERTFGCVRLTRLPDVGWADGPEGEKKLLLPGRFPVPGLGTVSSRLFAGPAAGETDAGVFLENIPQKKYTKWFDYDKIIKSAGFRTRLPGDYLTIDGALHKKSLKQYMIEEKIPAGQRDCMVLLADGAHVMWVPGYRISAAYKVTEKTAVVLEVSLEGFAKEGRSPVAGNTKEE